MPIIFIVAENELNETEQQQHMPARKHKSIKDVVNIHTQSQVTACTFHSENKSRRNRSIRPIQPECIRHTIAMSYNENACKTETGRAILLRYFLSSGPFVHREFFVNFNTSPICIVVVVVALLPRTIVQLHQFALPPALIARQYLAIYVILP